MNHVFAQTKLALPFRVAVITGPSGQPLPRAPAKHGGDLTLELRAAKDKTAVRALAQAPQNLCTQLILTTSPRTR
jgi:hypothetical protein